MHLKLTCYPRGGPCLTLPQSAFLWNGRRRAALETEGPGGGLGQGAWPPSAWLGSGQPPAGGSPLTLPVAVAPSSSPAHMGSGSQGQRFGLWGWRRTGARLGHGHQASQGGLPYLQVLSPHVHRSKGQLHLLPAGVLVPLVGNFDEDQEDSSHDAPSHQHEDPCGQDPAPQLLAKWAAGPLQNPPSVIRGVNGEGEDSPAMFSKVRVAGALLRESHSWYLTHVLSRSSIKPFS